MTKEINYKELLEVGQVYKNYKALCEMVGEDVKTGSSKKSQIKRWNRYFEWSMSGHTFTISKKFDEPKAKVDFRGGANNKVKEPLTKTHPKLSSEWIEGSNGVLTDKITRRALEKYWWECAKCQQEVFQSPVDRIRYPIDEEHTVCEFCTLSAGAKKIYLLLREYDLSFKLEVMFEDLVGISGGMLRYDFAVYNDKEELLTLIEYDGEYHDEDLNPCSDNYLVISTHDQLKDDYCKENNIHLLRIHHSKSDVYKQLIYNHFDSIGLSEMLPSELSRIDTSLSDQWQEELTLIKNKIKELEEKASHLQSNLEVWS